MRYPPPTYSWMQLNANLVRCECTVCTMHEHVMCVYTHACGTVYSTCVCKCIDVSVPGMFVRVQYVFTSMYAYVRVQYAYTCVCTVRVHSSVYVYVRCVCTCTVPCADVRV